MKTIDKQVQEFVTDLLSSNPEHLYEITGCLITSLGTVIMAGSLNHSSTMRHQGDLVLENLDELIDNIVENAEYDEKTKRKH